MKVVFLQSWAVVLAERVGIIGLIASGYGVLTWGFIAVFVIPVLTMGMVRVIRHCQ